MNNEAGVFIHNFQAWLSVHKQHLYMVVAALALLAAGGYYYWRQRTELYTAGYSALIQGYEDLAKAHEDPALWDDLQLAGQVGNDTYGSTVLAPYFHALEAEAYVQSGDLDQALKKMEMVMEGLSRSNPLYYSFKIKQAQMQMSHENEAIAKQGLSALQKLAENESNPQQDESLFYVGYHYWLQNDKEKAFHYWHMLRDLFGEDQQIPSPWVQIIQDFAFDAE